MPSPPPPPRARLRARDADRVAATNRLDAAYAAGMLRASEYHDRLFAAKTAATVGDLAALVRDLPNPDGPSPLTGISRHDDALRSAGAYAEVGRRTPKTWMLVVAGVVLLVIIGVGTVGMLRASWDTPAAVEPATESSSTESAALPDAVNRELIAASGPVQPLTEAGLTEFIALYNAQFGDFTVHDIALYPAYVVVSRSAESGQSRLNVYDYVDGFAPASSRSRPAGTAPIPLDAIDAAGLTAAIAQAPALIGVPDGEVRHVLIADTGIASASIYAYSADGTRGGYVRTNLAGEVIQVVPAD
ncbi:MAG: DUF1707 domain-containing protein [Rhodococcus sp.]|nr:DUF1707 domain-containing protein [Rhodococcus sp. (in: high G+C Gram-positive bacteria)]